MIRSSSLRVCLLASLPVALTALSVAACAQQAAAGGQVVHAKKPSPAILADKKQATSAKETAAVAAASKEAKPGSFDGPPQLPHPHKIYVDTLNNRLYWPADKPFWVRLAISPEDDAPSFLLPTVSSDTDVTTSKKSKEGIGLDITGKQAITWYNAVTKENVSLQFFSDGAPPVTKATCAGAPTYVDPQSYTYYGVGLTCSLASSDELSGVDGVFASVGDYAKEKNFKYYEDYKPYLKTLVLNKENSVIFRYYAVDHTGYAETPSTMRFTVDLTAPTTVHAIVGNAIGDVLSTQAKFKITSTDALSGVATVHARFDNQDFKQVTTGEVPVDTLPDGNHVLSYYSVDRVSNTETEHKINFYLDRTPPTVAAAVVGDLSESNGTRYVSSRSQVKLTSQDNKIGVDKITYAYDGTKYQTFADLFTLPATAGRASLSYRASDKLGNTSDVASLPYVMDLAPPKSSYKIVGPVYQVRSDFYIRLDSRIDLSATDDASGVQMIQYQTQDAADPSTYTTPLVFADEGRRLLRYWSTDKVNNRELDQALILITDNTPPEIFDNFSLSAKPGSAGKGLPIYRKQTSLFLGATDNASGVKAIFYSFDGGKETEYTTPLILDREGTFDLLIRAEDNLGNQSSKHVRYVVSN